MEWWLDLVRVEDMKKGTVLWRKVMDQLKRRYQVVEKETVVLTLLLKRKIQSGSTKSWQLAGFTEHLVQE